MHFWQNSGLLAQKSVFGRALMGMIFFHLTLLWYQNIKTSLCTLFKNVWVMLFCITFRSARKKLHVTVFFDHPVIDYDQQILTHTWTSDLQGDLWGVWDETWEGLQQLCREGDQGRPLSPEPQIHSLKEQAKASSTKDPFQHLLWMFNKQLFMLTNFRQGLTFSLASNHLADRTDPEIRTLRLLHLLVIFSSDHLTGLLHDSHAK